MLVYCNLPRQVPVMILINVPAFLLVGWLGWAADAAHQLHVWADNVKIWSVAKNVLTVTPNTSSSCERRGTRNVPQPGVSDLGAQSDEVGNNTGRGAEPCSS